ncbi:MAG: MarR family winged helix-turn-helix transcriptional regulator [Betaproteobacteria bacterium]
MQLESFFPYRLAVAADAVSRSIAQVYGERFDLGRDEWRVLAALADAAMLRTSAVIERTTLDKVAVSRALARLEGRGLVERRTDPEDGRGYLIRLRTAGRALLGKLTPMVREREAFLLAGLDEAERRALDAALGKVLERANQLAARE